MSRAYFENLGWLPKPPSDFNQRCSALKGRVACGAEVRALATHALDENQLERLARAIKALGANRGDLRPLTPFRLGLLGNGTLEFIMPALVASAARHGLALECVSGGYGQVLQDALDPQSEINRFKPDAVLVSMDYRALPLRACPGDKDAASACVAATKQHFESIRQGIRTHTGAVTILQTLAHPPEPLFGSFDRTLVGTLRCLIDEVNGYLSSRVAETNDALLDVEGLAAAVGSAEWFSPAQWNMAKLPFSSSLVPLYADHVARILAAIRGKSRRCLILDLDNTLWGGVIGDDGIDGIKIAEGDPIGEAFRSLQQMVLDLRGRGVVIAVSSKNEDATARLPFQRHPEMLLREEHIAVFQANWKDKASNISAIAATLSLGLDSMVFVDDNPVERGLVRQTLPDVAVPELPEDPAYYARALSAAGYFDTIAFSLEDRGRAAFYEGNARRVALQAEVADLDAYLRSLQMEITFQPFDEVGRARITQLINKSNQFNLTTRRYTETQVASIGQDASCFTLQVRLADTIGDNGMISVVICRATPPDAWEIDTWLMSCRVLGRRVEEMILREIGFHAQSAGIVRLIGRYLPSERNMMVRDHYEKMGFSKVGQEANGSTTWELVLPVRAPKAPMVVNRLGFAARIALYDDH
jgi:FkbH-like protein